MSTLKLDPACGRRTKSELLCLRRLAELEPATATGRVAWVWPEIEAALATGKKLREVWNAADADGLRVPYPQFRVYVSRLRNRARREEPAHPPLGTARNPNDSPPALAPIPSDPFANLREQRDRKQSDGFRYDPFSIQKRLVE